MKKSITILLLFFLSVTVSAQSDRSIEKGEYLLGVGINTINSLGSKDPLYNPGDWAFRTPISLSLETRWARLFSLDVALNFNGFEENEPLDAAGPPDENITYWSLDSSLKYYFGEFLLPRSEWIDFYGSAGLGIFTIEDTNISVNVGGGMMIWPSKRSKSFGIKLQGVGKFAFNHSNNGRRYPNNHFQYSLQFLFRL